MKSCLTLTGLLFVTHFIFGQGNVGIGLINPTNKLDILNGGVRIGVHPSARPLYVTGDIGPDSNGVEIRLNNGTQGIGIGFNTLYTTGTHTNQPIGLKANGTGYIFFKTGGSGLIRGIITDAGHFGIGTLFPHSPLQFQNITANRKLVLYEDANNDHEVYGFGVNVGIMRYQAPNPSSHHIFYAGINSTSSLELMRITGSGNVGIKNNNPHAPLQFENIGGNRKIVLWEGNNNDHQFHGFGVNSNLTRYQIPHPVSSHVFYAGTSDSTSAELMRITGTGNVGIGLQNIQNKLDVHHGAARTGTHPQALSLYVTGNMFPDSNGVEFRHSNGTSGIGFGYNTIYATGTNSNQTLNFKSRGAGHLQFITNGAVRAIINGAGNIGIGTLFPNAPLQFASITASRKLVLYEDVNNDHQVYGFGVNEGILRYQVAGPATNHVFYAGTNATSSLELMRITGSGNVGIKNSTPHAPLQFENIGGNRKMVMWETANNDHEFHGFGVNTLSTRYQVPTPSSSHVFYAGTSDESSAELMRITGTGRVGIGTSQPNELLEVGGTGRAFFGDGAGPSRKGLLIDGEPTSSRIESYNYAGSTPMSLLLNTLGGNVAINLTNANNKLDVHSGNARTGTHPQGLPLYVTGTMLPDSNGVEFRHSNGTSGIGFGHNTIYATGTNANQDLHFKGRGTGGLYFKTNQNWRMMIGGNGNVGIGTLSPHALLQFGEDYAPRKIVLYELFNNEHQVTGFGNDLSHSLLYKISNASAHHIFYAGTSSTSSSELMRITGSGNVGIGVPVPTQRLVVSGNGVFTGTVTANCGVLSCSDMRYKTNVMPLSNALQMVSSLNGMYYHWDQEKFPEKNFNDERQIGVAAQELEKVLPELVHTDSEGYKTVDYSRLTPVLIEAIKEQQSMIDSLKKENEAMRNTHHEVLSSLLEKMSVLEASVNELKSER